MANFKVGDRVRIVAVDSDKYPASAAFLGVEGTIKADGTHPIFRWEVHLDKPVCGPSGRPEHRGGLNSCHLAPLTDPKAEQFVGGLKRLAREPQPVTSVHSHEEGVSK